MISQNPIVYKLPPESIWYDYYYSFDGSLFWFCNVCVAAVDFGLMSLRKSIMNMATEAIGARHSSVEELNEIELK